MAVRNVLTMGDERLLRVAQPVARFDSPELRAVLADMRETMQALDGAGLAAPQIGVGLRIIIFGLATNPRYPEAEPVPDTVLINPTLTPLAADMEDSWEGCLSVPGMRGLVPRYKSLHYSGYDEHGNFFERSVTDFHARVVQHEVDHLDGVLYPMRIRDMRNFGFSESLFAAHAASADSAV
ncbi:MAG TPA: peptide deformylase [Steroidobacteraceae bacterium]